MYNTMKKNILYMVLFLATVQIQEATQQEGFAAVLQKLPEAITASSSEEKIQVFPNPVSEILQVQVPSTIPSITLSFYDTNGRLMRAQSSQSGGSTQSIDVSAFPSGTYLLVAGDKGIWRVVKQ
jgi:hypothetical protein